MGSASTREKSTGFRVNRILQEPFVYRESMLLWMLLGALLVCLVVLGPFYVLVFVALIVYALHDFVRS